MTLMGELMAEDKDAHESMGSKWEFNEQVTETFDDMLSRSIPQYSVMRGIVTAAASFYSQPNSYVLDLGCSRGEALARCIQEFAGKKRNLSFAGVEVSEPMRKAAEERFQDLAVPVFDTDLRYGFPQLNPPPSVILSVLTLQFIPIEYRQAVLYHAYEALKPGGALILVEKVLGATHPLNDWMVNSYLAMKASNGYGKEEIERKRLSLEGVLVPLTAKFNEALLAQAGFHQVDCIWRWLNFSAWLAIK